MATRAHLETILREAGETYHVLPLQGQASALITRRGARVLGLFPAPDADNLLWTNSAAFDTVAGFRDFVAAGHWNLGGERIWIAPEIQYNVRDRNDFWGTLHVPPEIDPGNYELYPPKKDAIVALTMNQAFEAYNLGTGIQPIYFDHRIRSVENPLHAWPQRDALMQDVLYCGLERKVFLDVEHTNTVSEAWNLVQVNAGGQLIIPCMPFVEASDYFGSVPNEARQIHQGDVPHLRLALNGKQQYKIGYKSICMTGRMGYHHALPDGRDYLLIRSFFNNPSNIYAEEPPDKPGVNGHSVHVYNDGGEFGGANSFGEMECTGKTLRGGSWIDENDHTRDVFVMWAYVGAPDAIRQIAHVLLGVRL